MDILITGGSGFIGQALLPALENRGHSVTLLSRQQRPLDGKYQHIGDLKDIADSAQFNAVINLAGANMAGRRWSKRYKRELLNSRLQITRSLLQLLQRLQKKPQVLLSASAVGFYGHHGDEALSESGTPVPGFAQSLCEQWETQAQAASELGIRTCLMRLGVVLDKGGGAFNQMARPFRLGVGNWIGDGRQWLSWIHRKDAVAAMLFLLEAELTGPFNLTAPKPVTSRGFCSAMQTQRRTLLALPIPAQAMRLIVGEMADELLINGQRVIPSRLQQAGFHFNYTTLEEALQSILEN